MKAAFNSTQKKLIIGFILAYSLAYFIRLNLSAALSSIIIDLQINPSTAGLLQTCFAIVYAIGQMVNGMIADRINPVRYILIGLLGSVVCNVFIGISSAFWMMAVFCILNGVFQSMLWTPIVRLIAVSYSDEDGTRIRANFLVSMTLVLGHFGAWAISGYASNLLGWRYSFLIPAAFVLLMIPLVYFLIRCADPVGKTENTKKGRSLPVSETFRIFIRTGFLMILISTIFYGFVKDGIVTWTPELLNVASNGNSTLASSFSLIIPVINLLGIIFGYWLKNRSGDNTRKAIVYLLPLTALFCIPLFLTSSLVGTAIALGLACANMYGLNPLITSLIPMEYDHFGCVGLAAGLIDSFAYLGSALAGVLGGTVYENFGSAGLSICWIVISLLAMLFAFFSSTAHCMKAMKQN